MKKKSILAAALAASMVLPSNLSTLSLLTPVAVLASDPDGVEEATPITVSFVADDKGTAIAGLTPSDFTVDGITDGDDIPVAKYLFQVPEGYHLTGEPEAISATEGEAGEDGTTPNIYNLIIEEDDGSFTFATEDSIPTVPSSVYVELTFGDNDETIVVPATTATDEDTGDFTVTIAVSAIQDALNDAYPDTYEYAPKGEDGETVLDNKVFEDLAITKDSQATKYVYAVTSTEKDGQTETTTTVYGFRQVALDGVTEKETLPSLADVTVTPTGKALMTLDGATLKYDSGLTLAFADSNGEIEATEKSDYTFEVTAEEVGTQKGTLKVTATATSTKFEGETESPEIKVDVVGDLESATAEGVEIEVASDANAAALTKAVEDFLKDTTTNAGKGVKFGDTLLVCGTDYTVDAVNKDAGTFTIKVGSGTNYAFKEGKESVALDVTITTEGEQPPVGDKTFTGNDVKADSEVIVAPTDDLTATAPNVEIKVTENGSEKTLGKDTEFSVEVVTTPKPALGTQGKITISGKGAYISTIPVEKDYTPFGDLAEVLVSNSKGETGYVLDTAPVDKEVAATALADLVQVTWGGDTLTASDYKITVKSLPDGETAGKFTIDPAETNPKYKYKADATPTEYEFTVKSNDNRLDLGDETKVTIAVGDDGYIKLTANDDGTTKLETDALGLTFKDAENADITLTPDTDYELEVEATAVGTVGKVTVKATSDSALIKGTKVLENIKVVGDLAKATLDGVVEVQVNEGSDADAVKVSLKGQSLKVKIGTVTLTADDYEIDDASISYTSSEESGKFKVKAKEGDSATCVGSSQDLDFAVSFLDPNKTPIVDASVEVEDVTVAADAGADAYKATNIKVTLANGTVVADTDYDTEITPPAAIGEEGTVVIKAKASGDYTGKTQGTYKAYGNLADVTVETVELEVSGDVNVDAVKAALAQKDLTVKFGTVDLTKDTDYEIDPTTVTLEADNASGTFSISAKDPATKVKGTKANIPFTVTTQTAPQGKVDLGQVSAEAITFDATTGKFKTLTFKTADGETKNLTADTDGKFADLVLDPEALTTQDADGKYTAVEVKVKPADGSTAYEGELPVAADKVTPAATTPEGPGEDDPAKEVTSWKVQFVEGTDSVGDPIDVTDKVADDKLAVDAYLTSIPAGYHYASEPKEIDFTTVDPSGDNKDTKVFTIEIKANAATDKENMTADSTAEITVPYTGAATGELTVPYKDSYTADDLNKEIKGGTTTDALAKEDLTPTIYYEDENDGFVALGYKSKGINVAEDKNDTLEGSKDPVTVEVAEGLPPLNMELGEVAKNPENSTLTYVPNYDAITNELNEKMKEVYAQSDKPAKYTFTVKAKPAQEGTKQNSNDKEVDLENVVDITITINPESYIRLLIPTQSTTANPSGNVEPNAAPVLLSDLEEEKETGAESVALLVLVSDVDNNPTNKVITTDEINAYIQKTSDLKDEKGVTVDKDQLSVPKNVELSIKDPKSYTDTVKDGYFEANIANEIATHNPSRNPSSGSKPKPKPEEPAAPVVGTPTPMYRLYNKLNGEHLFTTDKAERDNLLTSDTWSDEGQGWTAPSVSDTPVYRLLNPNTGDHHYTTDKNEFDTLPSYGWVAEGIAFFSADKDNAENVILHRLYNPNATGAGSHHYTADTNERDTLVAQGWKYEGTAWAGLPAGK